MVLGNVPINFIESAYRSVSGVLKILLSAIGQSSKTIVQKRNMIAQIFEIEIELIAAPDFARLLGFMIL